LNLNRFFIVIIYQFIHQSLYPVNNLNFYSKYLSIRLKLKFLIKIFNITFNKVPFKLFMWYFENTYISDYVQGLAKTLPEFIKFIKRQSQNGSNDLFDFKLISLKTHLTPFHFRITRSHNLFGIGISYLSRTYFDILGIW